MSRAVSRKPRSHPPGYFRVRRDEVGEDGILRICRAVIQGQPVFAIFEPDRVDVHPSQSDAA